MKKFSLVCFCALILLMTTETFAQGTLVWNGKAILVHRTSHDPGATTAFGRLWISFAGTDSNRTVNVINSVSGFSVDGGPGPISGKRSRYGVRIASQCGALYVAYTGLDGNSSVNVTESINGGATWPFQVVIGSADTSPTITDVFGSSLGVVWLNDIGVNGFQAQSRLVGCNLTFFDFGCLFPGDGGFCSSSSQNNGAPAWDAGNGRGRSRGAGLPMLFNFPPGPEFSFNVNSISAGPFMVFNPGSGHHYVAWRGGDNRINVGNLNTGAHLISADTTPNTPALAIFNNQLFVVWRGNDSRINIGSTNLF